MSDTERSSSSTSTRKKKRAKQSADQASASSSSPASSSVHHRHPNLTTNQQTKKKPASSRDDEADDEHTDNELEHGQPKPRKKLTQQQAKDQLKRWSAREEKRQTERHGTLKMGEKYETAGGEFGFAKGQAGQPRVTETKEEHGNSSYGAYGDYARAEREITPELAAVLAGKAKLKKNASEQDRALTAFGVGTMEAEQHLSRAPGIGKYERATYRRFSTTGKKEHNPFAKENSPAHKSTADARKRISGEESELSDNTLDILRYASASSDSEQETGTRRHGLVENPIDDPEMGGVAEVPEDEEKDGSGQDANSTTKKTKRKRKKKPKTGNPK